MTNSADGAGPEDLQSCAVYLKALGDPLRLQIVRALQAGPMTVSDIAQLLELEIANASHHLRVLYHAKIATTKRDGKYIYYNLNTDFINSRSANRSLDFGCCQFALKR